MRESPPKALIDLLERLELATSRQVVGVYRRARGLARDLPLLESVWVDALAQARILTPFQANQINAGRGEALGIGPYVLCQAIVPAGYATLYEARHRQSGQQARLAVIEPPGDDAQRIASALERLAAASATIEVAPLAPVREAGVDGQRVWAAANHVSGKTAAEWMVHNGRFPPEVVLEMARQMLVGLVALERAGLCHGDLGPAAMVLSGDGRVVMPQPGLREVARPEEGYAHADLLPEAYDYLAPERINDGTAPTVASDLYACGCLWWHLLTGRAPVPGGSSLAKLRAVQTARIPDVQRLAPDTPSPLAAAITACLHKHPARRPESMAQLAARLGPSTHAGQLALARSMTRPGRRTGHYWVVSMRTIRQSSQTPLWLAGIAGCVVAAVALGWSIYNARIPLPTTSIRGEAPPAARHLEPPRGQDSPRTPELTPARPSAVAATPAGNTEGEKTNGVGSLLRQAADHVKQSSPENDSRPPADRVLPADGPLRLDRLDLQPGQCVRGDGTGRPLVMLPRGGLSVTAENVRFENIDFVWDGGGTGSRSEDASAAMVALGAGQTTFRGCSFRTARATSGPPVAIRWIHPADGRQSQLSLPSGRIEVKDCVFSGVGAGIECRTVGARVVRLVNTLCLGPGPLVRLDHCPAADEPVVLSLSHTTVRGAAAVLECRYDRVDPRPGGIAVEGDQCAFVLGQRGSLLLLTGRESPAALLAEIQWTGQGSLVAPQGPVALWSGAGGRGEAVDDSSLSMAGLVRSAVEFAGPAEDGPAASRVTRWQGPLRSTDPPGVDPAVLSLPDVPSRQARTVDNPSR